MDFTRGDAAYHYFAIPATSWVAGGKLFFAAKPVIDDDNTDANALIQCNWTDSSVSDIAVGELLGDGVTPATVPMKQYACTFPPSATNSIISNGAESADYLGEFQYVPPSGVPVTYPATSPKIDAKLWFDIKRETT